MLAMAALLGDDRLHRRYVPNWLPQRLRIVAVQGLQKFR
jgi:hypothetical protein